VAEEIGLAGAIPAGRRGATPGASGRAKDKVHFFELRLDRLPELQLDNREIIGARLISPSELRGNGADRAGRRSILAGRLRRAAIQSDRATATMFTILEG